MEVRDPGVVRLRPACRDDADDLQRLVNVSTTHDVGMAALRPGELARRWSTEGGAEEHVVAEDVHGEIVGVLWGERAEESSRYREVHVMPAVRHRGVERLLCDAAEDDAQRAAAETDVHVVLSVNISDRALDAAFEKRGYERGMSDIAMFFDLAREMPAPEWPPGIALRAYRSGVDDRLMHRVMRRGFGPAMPSRDPDSWIDGHRRAPGFHPDLWLFAAAGDEVVGAVMCREQWGGQADTGWIKNIAVVDACRGRGIGRALLLEAFRRLSARGRTRVVLGVEESNAGARGFYEAIGMRPGGSSVDFVKRFAPERLPPS